MEEITLGKNILDFGGGKEAKYRHLIPCESYDSINIDPQIKPTWIIKVGEHFPSPKNYYDTVISLNTFEHIYDVHFTFKEIYKSLRPGGNFIFSTPFLYPIHAHPNDYIRPTNSWIKEALLNTGFKNIKITSLIWGPFSTALICLESKLQRKLMHLALFLDIFYLGQRLKRKNWHPNESDYPTGYFVEAQKITLHI
ncbi:MAG: methyltransferase domain-containing protein [Halobacteriovoraceae bacterium]|nr:methyltransferase domain-containing protein [Halobacteriovoraceae bacterium]